MARFKAVLFDIDGTLLDSNDAHAHAWLDALRGHGKNVPFDLLRAKIGMGGDKLLCDVAGIDHESVEGKSIVERRIALFKGYYLPDVAPLPGARQLVERLRARGLVCAAVSSAKAADLADLLRIATVADLLDPVISSDDADHSKPDPDLLELALQRLGLTAQECVYVGDTPYDIAACQRAGVPVIGFRSGGWDDRALRGAIAIYDDPQDLASRLDASPIFTEPGEVEPESTPVLTPRRPRRPAMGM